MNSYLHPFRNIGALLISTIPALFMACLPVSIYGQQAQMMIFNLESMELDSFLLPIPDTSATQQNSNFSYGEEDAEFEFLEQEYPSENLIPNTQFTEKKQASQEYSISKYPFRTAVKLFSVQNDSLSKNCSGMVISQKHILSAAHCFFQEGQNVPRADQDTLKVCPIFDNGIVHPEIECSAVSKIYSFPDWGINDSDFAILELSEPLGKRTGWVSIGFNDHDEELEQNLYYRLSYPNSSYLNPGSYNGDTLYYAFGKMDLPQPHFLGIQNAFCDLGESGSHLLSISNETTYTTYGTLTYGINCRHNRITREIFNALAFVIKDDLILSTRDHKAPSELTFFPNPTTGVFQLKHLELSISGAYSLFNQMGQLVRKGTLTDLNKTIDISGLPDGLYVMRMFTSREVITGTIIKHAARQDR